MTAKKTPGADSAPAIEKVDIDGPAVTLEMPPETEAPPVEESVSAPRKRGRPRKDGGSAAPEVANSVSGPARVRSRKASAKTVYSRDAEDKLAKQIIGLHTIGAMMTGIPEMAIGVAEGEMLAAAVLAVAAEYNLELSGKAGAAIQLLAACAAIYVPRLLMVKQRVAQQQAMPNVTTADTVN